MNKLCAVFWYSAVDAKLICKPSLKPKANKEEQAF